MLLEAAMHLAVLVHLLATAAVCAYGGWGPAAAFLVAGPSAVAASVQAAACLRCLSVTKSSHARR